MIGEWRRREDAAAPTDGTGAEPEPPKPRRAEAGRDAERPVAPAAPQTRDRHRRRRARRHRGARSAGTIDRRGAGPGAATARRLADRADVPRRRLSADVEVGHARRRSRRSTVTLKKKPRAAARRTKPTRDDIIDVFGERRGDCEAVLARLVGRVGARRVHDLRADRSRRVRQRAPRSRARTATPSDASCVRCAVVCTTTADCPTTDYTCGVDGLCHAPGGALVAAARRRARSRSTTVASPISITTASATRSACRARRSSCATATPSAPLSRVESIVTPSQTGPAAFGDLDGDGTLDVDGRDPRRPRLVHVDVRHAVAARRPDRPRRSTRRRGAELRSVFHGRPVDRRRVRRR